MIREDFLLRLIRQVVLLLAASREQRAQARYEQALDTVDEAARSLLGLDSGLLGAMPHGTLLTLLSPEGSLDLQRAVGVGMLLQERAAILDLQGQAAQADQARLRSVSLWLDVVAAAPRTGSAGPHDAVVVDDALLADLSELADQAPTDHLDLHHRRALVAVHAAAGRLDRAEDELFALVQLGDDGAIALGRRIFEQALAAGQGDEEEVRAVIDELAALTTRPR